jgi:transposase
VLCRVQQDTVGHRGHKDDPIYKVRGLLRHGAEHLSPRQVARVEAALEVGDPDWEVTVAWGCYQRLRSIYHQRTQAAGKHLAADLIATLHTCPIPEVARLGRTLRAWQAQVLAYLDTGGVSNGGADAINLIIEKTRRVAHGCRTSNHCRLRILLAASSTRPWRVNHA